MAKNNLVTQQGAPVNNAAEVLNKSGALTHAELDNNFFSIYVATNGTAEASKALIVDASRNIGNLATVTATTLTDGTATITGGALTGLTTAITVAQGGTGRTTSLEDNIVHLVDSKASGTASASGTTATWVKRECAEVAGGDTGGLCTVTLSVIVLAAGTYYCSINTADSLAGASRLRLRNTTAGTTLVQGANSQSGAAYLSGKFTVAAAQNLEIQHYQTVGTAFGTAMSEGTEPEIYLQAEFIKLD